MKKYKANAKISRSNRKRKAQSFKIRVQAAKDELILPQARQRTNGDERRFDNKIGNFSKSLPHNDLGEVDVHAYKAMVRAIDKGRFKLIEQVPKGVGGRLLNPLGGFTFTIEGPDSPAVNVELPPSLKSPEFAAQMAELYWMALLRDIPFSDYDSDPLALEARQDLATFSGYTGPRDHISGEVRAQDLFRIDYPGVLDGPLVSQFVMQSFRYDGIPIEQKISTALANTGFMTQYAEWLNIQRGGFAPPNPRDPQLRFVRNARDLGQTAGQDFINSQYFKSVLIILGLFGFVGLPLDPANPFKTSNRQLPFSTFGIAHIAELVGKAHKSERHTWYQKWNVHRFLRPEAGGGRVHNVKTGAADYPIHPDLLENSLVLDLIFELNRKFNLARFGENVGTYLLPQMFSAGSPTHPSFPAGHAISAGACVTVLKAFFDESAVFPNPLKPAPDGLSTEPYVPGVDGPELTLGGELNKLAHNLSFGRDMSGVHWRADNTSGNAQGEEVAIRMLREEKVIYPEPFEGFSLTKFNGESIIINERVHHKNKHGRPEG